MMRSCTPLRRVAACLAVMLVAPTTAIAQAANGGAAAPSQDPGPAPSTVGGTAPTATTIPPLGAIGPNTLQAAATGALLGSPTTTRGRLTPTDAGRPVLLQMFDAQRGWIPVAGGKADPTGSFSVSWRPQHIGRFLLRAVPGGKATTSDLSTAPTAPIEVYRSVIATYFGPGSYGSRTACGQILTPQLIGVAHQTLPCGTMVDILYGSRKISVPVVDRGPYANGATYDLTAATAAALGISGTVHLGALALRGGAPSAP